MVQGKYTVPDLPGWPVKINCSMEKTNESFPAVETILDGSRFVRACLRRPVDRTPVWFLRQAGRYMQEYRDVRKHHTLVEICKLPELAAEVTITAAEKLGVDAAIIFADLLLPLEPMGLDFEFQAGEGKLHAESADVKGPGPKVDATSATWLGLLSGTLKPWLAFTRGMVVCRAGLTELRWLQQVAERLQRAYAE